LSLVSSLIVILQSTDDFLPWAKVILRFQALKTRRKCARDRHVFSTALFDMLAEEGLQQGEEELAAARQRALRSCLENAQNTRNPRPMGSV